MIELPGCVQYFCFSARHVWLPLICLVLVWEEYCKSWCQNNALDRGLRCFSISPHIKKPDWMMHDFSHCWSNCKFCIIILFIFLTVKIVQVMKCEHVRSTCKESHLMLGKCIDLIVTMVDVDNSSRIVLYSWIGKLCFQSYV